jgi:hypothetical protein
MPRRNVLKLVAALVLLAGCSKPASHAFTTQVPTTEPPVTTTTAPEPAPMPAEPMAFTGAGLDLHAAAPVPQANLDAAWAGVLQTMNQYLEAAVLTPLRSGGPAGDLTPLFTSVAVDRVMAVGPDRFAFIDENLLPASDLRQEAATVTMTALAGPNGVMSVIAAEVDLRLTGHISGAPLTVTRSGEVVLMPEGGTWRIDAWDLTVTRTVAEDSTKTTAAS